MFDLEEIGLGKNELQERVIEKMSERLLESIDSQEDGDTRYPSMLQSKLQEFCQKKIDEAVQGLADKHVLPNVVARIEGLCLKETNKWGESKGTTVTFIEYLIQRAEHYMQEQVSYEGKSKSESSGYSWSAAQTRITYLVHQHLHYSIKTAIEGALKDMNTKIAKGLEETCRIKMREFSEQMKIKVDSK